MSELAFRQVHLDFHTSPLIPDVGVDFDPEQFAATLAAAHVDSVTVFAKCHHGMSYYPTEVGVVHPSLRRDLLGEMMAACKARDILTPIYITVVWDEHSAHEHPEWLQVNAAGQPGTHPPFTASWKWLCMNSPYLDYVAAQTDEIVRRYDAPGYFFDIIMMTSPGCLCRYCIDGMVAEGLDPQNADDQRHYANAVAKRAMARLSQVVRAVRPDARIFYNSRLRLAQDAESGVRSELQYETHLEVESLPSGLWGYMHYPLFSRYVQTLGVDFLGMTARFHKSWADFGGLKNEAALEYEVFSMLATGAKCSIGDQLHPRGALEQPAYDLIGRLYASVEAKEPWCRGATAVQEVGVLLGVDGWDRSVDLSAEEGAVRMLLESQWQFQMVDALADYSGYKAIIVPEDAPVDADLAAKLRDYVNAGGSLIVAGRKPLEGNYGRLAGLLGIAVDGEADYSAHYIEAVADLGLADMRHVMYEAPVLVHCSEDSEVLARIVAPYFDRRWNHFSSHFQTAPDRVTEYPAITRRGRVIYIASPIFGAYRRHGNRTYRQIVEACLYSLVPEPAVTAEMPTSGQVTLMRQGERLVAHLLYYVPERRTRDIDIIEDVVTLTDVPLHVRTGRLPENVYLAPQQQRLNWSYDEGITSVGVPELHGHQMVVFEF
jgi:hypothetical protein